MGITATMVEDKEENSPWITDKNENILAAAAAAGTADITWTGTSSCAIRALMVIKTDKGSS